MGCIFIGQPPECSVCLETMKLNCLMGHQHIIVSEQGKKDLRKQLSFMINNPMRYKTQSGELQRPK